ncbi:hypothetical protein SEA_SHROOMS_33 [Arthrobacter phage Shrooms]|nr:hypothetical protein SEA_SHROOMS_33 [Arthrobacter phage Shrooms]
MRPGMMAYGALCPAVSADGKSVCIQLQGHDDDGLPDGGHVWDRATPGAYYLQACALCGGEIRVVHGSPQPHPCGLADAKMTSLTITLPDGTQQTITNPGFLGLLSKREGN